MTSTTRYITLQPISALYIIMAVLSCVITGYGYHFYTIAHHNKETAVQSQLAELQQSLDGMQHYATKELVAMQAAIVPMHTNMEAIHQELITRVNGGRGLVRFAWVDQQDKMRVSSVTGVRLQPSDVSKREYIQLARSTPNRVIISPILTHVVSGKPVIIFAMGTLDATHRYIGTLNAAINLGPLLDHIETAMRFCECEYAVLSPHGEPITVQGDRNVLLSQYSTADGEQFRVVGRQSPHAQTELLQRTVIDFGIILLSVMAALLGLYSYIRRRVLHPVAHTLNALQASMPTFPAPPDLPLEMRLLHLRDLSERFEQLQQHIAQSDQALRHAHQVIGQLTKQHDTLMHASGSQFRLTVDAITHYAAHLEDLILMQAMQPDMVYEYDDLREIGHNLTRIANQFQQISALRQAALPTGETVLLNPLIAAAALPHADALERRNLSLILPQEPSVSLTHHPDVLADLFESLFYAAIYYAQDESGLQVTCRKNEVVEIVVRVSAIRPSILNAQDRDYSVFLGSPSRGTHDAMRSVIERDVNVLLCESFLALNGDRMECRITKGGELEFQVQLSAYAPGELKLR